MVMVACLSLCFALSDSWARSDTEEMALSAAQAWLTLVDSGDYSGSWKEASAYFRGGVTPENWQTTMEAFRRPLGMVISREVMQAEESASLPGAPAGKYVVMRFISSFEKKQSAVETVTFMLDTDGKWRAVRYFIK
jgi:DNA gyrase inhibitor GyrI